MADFLTAQNIVKGNEGGYQNSPSDSGNFVDGQLIGTNYGIAAPTLKAYLGRTPTVSEMKNLSYDTASKIYKANYWNAINGDNINSQSIANEIYDGSVNEGVGGIKKIVTDSLGVSNSTSWNDIANQINSASDQQSLFAAIQQGRTDAYGAILSTDSQYSSWINRLKNITFTDAVNYAKNNTITIVAIAALVGVITFVTVYAAEKELGSKK